MSVTAQAGTLTIHSRVLRSSTKRPPIFSALCAPLSVPMEVRVVEEAERVEQARRAVEAPVAFEVADVAAHEGRADARRLCVAPRHVEEPLHEVDPDHLVAAPRELDGVAAVAAAKVDDLAARRRRQRPLEEVDLRRGVLGAQRLGHEIQVLLGVEELGEIEEHGLGAHCFRLSSWAPSGLRCRGSVAA
jgi:hypothetical protein